MSGRVLICGAGAVGGAVGGREEALEGMAGHDDEVEALAEIEGFVADRLAYHLGQEGVAADAVKAAIAARPGAEFDREATRSRGTPTRVQRIVRHRVFVELTPFIAITLTSRARKLT